MTTRPAKYYNGGTGQWENFGAVGTPGTDGVVVSATEPAAPYEGLLWIDTSSELSAATAMVPTGSINAFAGAAAPSGWLLCDGSTFSSVTYPDLAALVGDTYGTHSGTDYYLPNLKGRVIVGFNSVETEFDAIGEAGGSKTSTAPHTHDIDHNHASFSTSTGGTHDHMSQYLGRTAPGAGGWWTAGGSAVAADPANSDGSHTHSIDVPALGTTASGASSAGATSGNLQPYLTLNYIIKA